MQGNNRPDPIILDGEAHGIDCSMLNDITWNSDIEWDNIVHQNESEFVSEQK